MLDRDGGQRYDRLARWYDVAIVPTEALVRRERRRLLARARGHVLELGIGTGASLPFYPSACRVTGIDPSVGMLRRAQARARRLGRPLRAVVMAAEALGFPDSSFDTVVATLTCCSVEDPLRVFAEARRVLVPGGALLLLEHVRPHGRLGRVFDRLDPWWSTHVCHLNRRTGDLVATAGFQIRFQRRWARAIFHAIEAAR